MWENFLNKMQLSTWMDTVYILCGITTTTTQTELQGSELNN